jgi:hypothetical protein
MIRRRTARLSAGIVLGVAAFAAPVAALSGPASAAPTAATATYHGKSAVAASRLEHAANVSALTKRLSSFSPRGPRVLTHLAFGGTSTVGAGDAASSGASTVGGRYGLFHSFNGLSDLDQAQVNGGEGVGELTPPDQGLCVGRDALLPGDPKVVFEAINLAVRETSTNGTPLRPDFSLATLFDDPFAQGDVRCLYDARAQTFYFTEIGYPPGGPVPPALPMNTTDEVAVWNANGVSDYAFDSSLGDTCFGDQPKTGFNNNALLMSTDEYCGASQVEIGALTLVISKPELVAQDPTVDSALVGPVSLAGIPVIGLDPAINTGTGTGYLVNSFPYLDGLGTPNPVGNTLGLWTLTNTADVATDPGAITLSGTVIRSEKYAFPVPATSTGTGQVAYTIGGFPITSEAALNPDDSRLTEPVQVSRSPFGGIQLWTALSAAVYPHGDGTARDAAAWFRIGVGSQRVTAQGYVTARRANLLYPAVAVPSFGPPLMVFTITSKTINPSAAYAVLGIGRIITVATGAGAHLSFSDAPPFNSPRWGDYSFAQVDPSGIGVWMGTEYIPPAAHQDPIDNWGTYLVDVNQFAAGF